MSKFGFSTRPFGFSKAEVNAYLERLQRDSKEKEAALTNQLQQAQASLTGMKAEREALDCRVEELQNQLNYYLGKEAEIEKMSVSIGTMYLVAKQNAAEVVAQAEQAAKTISAHAKNQLQAAIDAESNLSGLEQQVHFTAEQFSASVETLNDSLRRIQDSLQAQTHCIENGTDSTVSTLPEETHE